MNALHPVLTELQIEQALTAVHRTLLDGGILMLGTLTPENQGVTIFRRSDVGFVSIRDINDGSFWRATAEKLRTSEH